MEAIGPIVLLTQELIEVRKLLLVEILRHFDSVKWYQEHRRLYVVALQAVSDFLADVIKFREASKIHHSTGYGVRGI